MKKSFFVLFIVFLGHFGFAHTDSLTVRKVGCTSWCTTLAQPYKVIQTIIHYSVQVAAPLRGCFSASFPCHGHEWKVRLGSQSAFCGCSGPYLVAPTTSNNLICPLDVLQFETRSREQSSKILLVTFFEELLRRSYASALYIVKDMAYH
jgi:hypothetical protein